MTEANVTDLSPVAAPPARRRGNLRSLGVLGVVVAAIGLLLSQGLLRNLNYFKTVDEALAQKSALGTQTLRLEGVVQPHTIARTNTGASFVLDGSGAHRVNVRVVGTPPQLFRANIPVVVVGHFLSASSLTFSGNQILVKHTANYIAAHPNRVKAKNGRVQ